MKAIVLVSLVCLLPACSSDDDSEMWERQSQNGLPVLRSSSEGASVLVCSGTASASTQVNGSTVKVAAQWSVYEASSGSAVNPGSNLSVGATSSNTDFVFEVVYASKNLSSAGVSASGSIKVKDLSKSYGRNDGDEEDPYPFGDGDLDNQVIKTLSFNLSGGSGTGTLVVQ